MQLRWRSRLAAAWTSPELIAARRHVGLVIGALALLGLAIAVSLWHVGRGFPGDTLTYYLAGLRLNDGGFLYDLRPQDAWHYDRPEFPLFGPPLIAVLWRPLVALLGEWSVIAWVLAMTFCALWAIAYLLIGTRGWAGVLVILLLPSIMLLIGVGNVDCLVLAGMIAVWRLVGRSRFVAAGLVVGALVSLKLTPGVLLLWLLGTRRWTALAWALGTVAFLALVAALGTAPDIWLRYARVIAEGTRTGQSGALVVLIVGAALVLLLGRWSRSASFIAAIVLMPFGSPQAAGHSWAILLAALVPHARGDVAAPPSPSTGHPHPEPLAD